MARSPSGQLRGSPSGVAVQSSERMRLAISPSPMKGVARESLRIGSAAKSAPVLPLFPEEAFGECPRADGQRAGGGTDATFASAAREARRTSGQSDRGFLESPARLGGKALETS